MRQYKPYTESGWFRNQNVTKTLQEFERICPNLLKTRDASPEECYDGYQIFWENNSLSETGSIRFEEAIEYMEEVMNFYTDFILEHRYF